MKAVKLILFLVILFTSFQPILADETKPEITTVKPWNGQFDFLSAPVWLNNTASQTVDWTVLDNTVGGPGGLYATWTNLDSTLDSYTEWSKTVSGWFGTGKNITLWYYWNGGANDSSNIILQSRVNSSYTDLILDVDSTGIVVGASSPVAHGILLTVSSYGREYRIKFHNIPKTGGGADNASTNDLQVALVPSGGFITDEHKNYLDTWIK